MLFPGLTQFWCVSVYIFNNVVAKVQCDAGVSGQTIDSGVTSWLLSGDLRPDTDDTDDSAVISRHSGHWSPLIIGPGHQSSSSSTEESGCKIAELIQCWTQSILSSTTKTFIRFSQFKILHLACKAINSVQWISVKKIYYSSVFKVFFLKKGFLLLPQKLW